MILLGSTSIRDLSISWCPFLCPFLAAVIYKLPLESEVHLPDLM